MIKYNRDKRGTYNARIRARAYDRYDAQDTQDKRARIHIPIHYDGYNRVEYIPIIYGKTRDTRARTYVNITNAIRDIFPEIDAPHTAQTYRATATYHKYIPTDRDISPPDPHTQEHTIYKDTRTVKCIIFNTHDKMIYYGWIRRTRIVDLTAQTATYTLHRNKRSIDVRTYIPRTDTIKGVSIQEIRKHDVEIYHI